MRTKCPPCGKEWAGLRAAHCSAPNCHLTFTSPNAFDMHQKWCKEGLVCLNPAVVGMVYDKAKDLYRFMTPDEEKDSMVCDPCKDGRHCMSDKCTCQHKPAAQALGVDGIDSGEAVGDIGGV